MTPKKFSIYLGGAMEKAKDLGAHWRTELTPFLEGLGFEVLNPNLFEPRQLKNLKPNRLPEYLETRDNLTIKPKCWHDLKFAKDDRLFARFQKYMQRIIRFDLSLVRNETSYMIVLWDTPASQGAGTHAEITEAFMNNVPVYMVATTEVPAWLLGGITKLFNDFDELKGFLMDEFEKEE